MMIYVVFLVGSIFFLSKCFSVHSKGLMYSFFVAMAFVFVLLFSLRYETGNDYHGYVSLYEYFVESHSFPKTREPFTYIVYWVSSFFDLGVVFVFFVYSLATALFMVGALAKLSSVGVSAFVMVTSGFLFFMNDQIRQALACAFVMFFGVRCEFKVGAKFYFSSVIGGLIHFSAILILPVIFVARFVSNKFLVTALPLLGASIYYFLDVSAVINKVVYFFPKTVSDRFIYAERFLASGQVKGVSVFVWSGIFMSLCIYFLFVSSRFSVDVVAKRSLSVCSVGLLLYFSTYDYFIFNRIFVYYLYFLLVPVSLILGSLPVRLLEGPRLMLTVRFPFYAVTVLGIIAIFVSYLSSDGGRHGGIPYGNYVLEKLI